ncbi:MAG: GGDEF domain-containing protein [Enterocloster clostridioformis]
MGQLIHPHDEAYFLESNQSIADGREEYHNTRVPGRERKRGVDMAAVQERCSGIKDGQPKLFCRHDQQSGQKNQIDHMTGLYNKYEFEENIKKYLADRKCMDTIGLMVLDMDSFKNINDLYDRSFGDEVLRITAQKVASMLPPNAMLYRLDGDEFGILLLGGDTKERPICLTSCSRTSANSRNTEERNTSVLCRRDMLLIRRMGAIIWSSLRGPTTPWNTPKSWERTG